VDRAALDVALEKGLPRGGWCPKGRRAEDGALDPHYPLLETPSEEYFQRTEWNMRDSDGTLVLTRGTPTEGTAFTVEIAKKFGKPCLVLDVAEAPSASAVKAWAAEHNVRVLNVAGPRESKCPGIYAQAAQFLRTVL
jgi:Circularly permutated YpsA SLOG family